MCNPILIGLGLAVGGTVATAVGNKQGIKASNRTIANELGRKTKRNKELTAAVTDEQMKSGATALAKANSEAAGEYTQAAEGDATKIAKSFAQSGAAGGGQAYAGQITQGADAAARRGADTARSQGTLFGFAKTNNDKARRMAELALKRSQLAQEDAASAAILPMELQAAARKGEDLRMLGTLGTAAGYGMIGSSMFAPASSGALATGAGSAAAQGPLGGWSSKRIYQNPNGSTGAFA